MLEAPFAWDDVGSWPALERMHPQDQAGNTVMATHAGINTENCVIVGEAGKLIATAGVRDLVIVQDGDAILIANRNDESALKQLVERIGKSDLDRFA
jgi:mannose-1-phosphate guanylyltransferase